MACLEDYPIIEKAINYGLRVRGQMLRTQDHSEITVEQIAKFWVDGWLEANKGKVSEEDAKIIRRGVDNWIWI